MRALDLQGQRFARLFVVSRAENSSLGCTRWHAVCDCGERVVVTGSKLRSGHTRSCGCLHRDEARGRQCRPTSEAKTAEYRSWKAMRARCANPKNNRYRLYGARGIGVCARWLASYDDFLRDMGRKPSPSHTLDRLNVNGDYEPSNCRWATPREQANNARFNHVLEHVGRRLSIADWARETGIPASTLHARISRHGWSVARALTEPVRARLGIVDWEGR